MLPRWHLFFDVFLPDTEPLDCILFVITRHGQMRLWLDGCATWQPIDREVIVYLGRSVRFSMEAWSISLPTRKTRCLQNFRADDTAIQDDGNQVSVASEQSVSRCPLVRNAINASGNFGWCHLDVVMKMISIWTDVSIYQNAVESWNPRFWLVRLILLSSF